MPQSYSPTAQIHTPLLTENGFTQSEELEILRIVERMHRGEEKMYSSEEVWKLLGVDD